MISILKPLQNLYTSHNKIKFDYFYINSLFDAYEVELLQDKESLSFLLSLMDTSEKKQTFIRAKIMKSFNVNNLPLFKTFISYFEKPKSYNNLFFSVLNTILFNVQSLDLLHKVMDEMMADEELRITLGVDLEKLVLAPHYHDFEQQMVLT